MDRDNIGVNPYPVLITASESENSEEIKLTNEVTITFTNEMIRKNLGQLNQLMLYNHKQKKKNKRNQMMLRKNQKLFHNRN